MIVSRGRSYVFIHIPKTGGTSLTLALEQRAMKDDILVGDTPKAVKRRHRVRTLPVRGRLWKHSTLADIDGLVTRAELESLFIFTLVRNPWDRVVSYYHWLRTQRFDHPAVSLAGALDFEAFVLHPSILQSLQDHPARVYMTGADGKEHATHYIRLEKFEADAAPLFDHLGFRVQLPQANRSERHMDYRRYYSEKSAAAVSSACAEDAQRFGYHFHDVDDQ